jgi:nitrogenase molybdenum-iron protein NifN
MSIIEAPKTRADQASKALADQPKVALNTATKSTSTTNACRMCMPLGACLAYVGFDATVPFLHGSQGCATYIRRYLISHFAEPMDIASSSVGEAATVFGGEANLRTGVTNVARVYKPQMIGMASTCLTETIGEDVPGMIARITHPETGLAAETGLRVPNLVFASTPSYAGTHADGYHAAVAAVVKAHAEDGTETDSVNIFPGIVSTADLRHLHEILDGYQLPHALLPDYSVRLDGATMARYEKLPAGGTSHAEVVATGRALASITLGGLVTTGVELAGDLLATDFGVEHLRMPMPIGIRLTDTFTDRLAELSGQKMPAWLDAERGRLVDAYIDGHKYAADRTAIVFGDEDLVLGVTSFLSEIGIRVVLAATGGHSGRLAAELAAVNPGRNIPVVDDSDFEAIEAAAAELRPDLLIGHSKGYATSRRVGIPLVRVGLPIHDRVGAQRLHHLGYRGTQELFDRIINTLIQVRQDESEVGYSYM